MIAVPADVKSKLDAAFEDGGLDADDTLGLGADLSLLSEADDDKDLDMNIDMDASDDV
jgi:hypothetical protein